VENDIWPKKWAETYVSRSMDMIHDWLVDKSVEFLPVVNWTERGLFKPGKFCSEMAHCMGNRPRNDGMYYQTP
jgi:predicted oxidoreductase